MVSVSKILTVSYGTFSCTLEGFDEPFTTMKAIAEYFRDLASEDRYFGAEPPTPDAQMLHQIAENAIQKRVSAQVGDNSVTLRADDGRDAGDDAGQTVQPQAPDQKPQATTAVTAPEVQAPEPVATQPAAQEVGTASADPKLEDEIEDALAARRAQLGTADVAADVTAEAPAPEQGYEEDEVNAADPANAPVVESVAGKLARIRALVAADRNAALAASGQAAPHTSDAANDTQSAPQDDDTQEEQAAEPASDFAAFEAVVDVSDNAPAVEAEAEVTVTDTPEVEAASQAPVLESALDSVLDSASDNTPETEDELSAWATAESDDASSDDAILAALSTDAEDDAQADDADPDSPADVLTSDEADLSDVIGQAMSEDDRDAAQATEAKADEPAAEDAPGDITAEALAEDTFEEALAAALDNETASNSDDTSEPASMQPEVADVAEVDDKTNDETATEADPSTEVATAAATQAEATSDESAEHTEDEAITPSMSELVQMRRVRVLKVRRSVVEAAEAKASAKAIESKPLELDGATEETAAEGDTYADLPDLPKTRPARAQSGRDRLAQIGIAHDGPAVERIIAATNDRLEEDDNRRRVNAISHLKAAVAATNAERQARGGAEPVSDEAADYRQDLQNVVRRPARTPRGQGANTAERMDDYDTAETAAAPVRERPAPLMLVSEQRIDAPSDHALELLQKRRILTGNSEPATQEDLEDARSFSEFAEELGASELTDLLEAAAAYVSFVEGRPHFTRPHIMGHVAQAQADRGYSREDGLRSFGTLLRNGTIRKLKRGQFVIADDSKFAPEARYAGE